MIAPGSQLSEPVEPVNVGKTEIENDCVVTGRLQCGRTVSASANGINGKSALAQTRTDVLAQARVVLHQQKSHFNPQFLGFPQNQQCLVMTQNLGCRRPRILSASTMGQEITATLQGGSIAAQIVVGVSQ